MWPKWANPAIASKNKNGKAFFILKNVNIYTFF